MVRIMMRGAILAGLVATLASCSGIASGDSGLFGRKRAQIEHVDRVVGDALHQQPELFLAAAQRFLRGAALGQVAGNLGKPEQPAGRIADRIDHHIGPEAAAVLAQAEPLGLEPADGRGRVQGTRRQSRGAVFLGIEAGEMLADDLGGCIALEPLGAGIPARDRAGRIEHVDRVVGDRIDQDAITLSLGYGDLFFPRHPTPFYPTLTTRADPQKHRRLRSVPNTVTISEKRRKV